jgi:Fanconi anemia group M protein
MDAAIQQFMRAQIGRSPDQARIEKFIPSEKESKMTEEVVVIVDSRELSATVTRELSKLGVVIRSDTLSVGDFVLSEKVAVERKEVDDFASSIIDGRLFEQSTKLKETYQNPIMLIEGQTLTGSGRVRPEAMMGAYASVLVDYGIPIVWTQKPSETAQLMFAIARREQLQEKRAPRIMTTPKPTTLNDQQEFIVSSLPNIDRTRAKRLLNSFQSVQQVFMASKEELMSVSGIGEKISEEVRKVLTSKYQKTGWIQETDVK